MKQYLKQIEMELSEAKLLTPVIVASDRCKRLSRWVKGLLPNSEVVATDELDRLMGRDVVLLHSGESGWDEALEVVCQQSPGRLFVIAPELPRVEALKLEWVADHSVVGKEIFEYEVHELGLSA